MSALVPSIESDKFTSFFQNFKLLNFSLLKSFKRFSKARSNSGIKLLSLPHLVIDEVLKHTNLDDLINLSLCSKKAHRAVKMLSRINEDVTLLYLPYRGYALYFPGEKVVIWIVSRIIVPLDLKTCHSFKYFIDEDMCTYWEDDVVGCQQTTNYICDIFRIPVSTVLISQEKDLWMLEFAQRRQGEKLKKVYIHDKFMMSAEEYESVLSCNPTESFDCMSSPPPDFEFPGILPPVKNLFILCGFWITRMHLLHLDSPNVQLWGTKFSSSDVSALVLFWLHEGVPNLKFVELHGSKIELNDLRHRFEPFRGKVTYKWKQDEEDLEFDHSFHIRREVDNAVATIKINPWSFTMVVWPDIDNNRVVLD